MIAFSKVLCTLVYDSNFKCIARTDCKTKRWQVVFIQRCYFEHSGQHAASRSTCFGPHRDRLLRELPLATAVGFSSFVPLLVLSSEIFCRFGLGSPEASFMASSSKKQVRRFTCNATEMSIVLDMNTLTVLSEAREFRVVCDEACFGENTQHCL